MAKGPKAEDETSSDPEPLQLMLAARVREARRNAKLKQSELADLTGNSQSFIFLVEKADTNVTLKNLIKIAQALKADPVHLLVSKETASLMDRNKVEMLSNLVQLSFQELQATSSSLAKLNDFLQQMHELLTDQKQGLSADPPPKD